MRGREEDGSLAMHESCERIPGKEGKRRRCNPKKRSSDAHRLHDLNTTWFPLSSQKFRDGYVENQAISREGGGAALGSPNRGEESELSDGEGPEHSKRGSEIRAKVKGGGRKKIRRKSVQERSLFPLLASALSSPAKGKKQGVNKSQKGTNVKGS